MMLCQILFSLNAIENCNAEERFIEKNVSFNHGEFFG